VSFSTASASLATAAAGGSSVLGDLPLQLGSYKRTSGPSRLCPHIEIDSDSVEDESLRLTPQISLRIRTGEQPPLPSERDTGCVETESAKRETFDRGERVVLTSTLKVVCNGRTKSESVRRARLSRDEIILEIEILNARSERCEFRRTR
jgi:hypothetical protein